MHYVKPFGEDRYTSGSAPTSFRFTGQRLENGLELYFYGARWYDSYLNRWTSPDSIIPDPSNPLDWDRYQYARSNPVKYTDPTGHRVDDGCNHEGCSFGFEDLKDSILRQNNWLKNNVKAGIGNDLDAFAQLSDYAAELSGNCVDCFVQGVGAVLTGDIYEPAWLHEVLAQVGSIGWDPHFAKDQLNQTGFAPIFQDQNVNGPQPHHYWFYVQMGYQQPNNLFPVTAVVAHETIIARDPAGRSYQDIALGMEGVQLGNKLATGALGINDVGNYIRQSLSPGSENAQFWIWLKNYQWIP